MAMDGKVQIVSKHCTQNQRRYKKVHLYTRKEGQRTRKQGQKLANERKTENIKTENQMQQVHVITVWQYERQ